MDTALLDILNKDTYITPYSRYISGNIIEYDIRAANINMLYKYGKIDINLYTYLANLPKQDREIYVGRMVREDRSIGECYEQGIRDHKVMLAEANNIKVEEIIRIAKDAVYINRPYILQNRIFGNVEFKIGLMCDVALILSSDLIIFYGVDNNGNMNIEVKGLGKSKELHANGMLSFIATLINTVERAGVQDGLKLISNFYTSYINKQLPIQFYRQFDSDSRYRVNISGIGTAAISDESVITDLNALDINYNAKIIREIFGIIKSKYKWR